MILSLCSPKGGVGKSTLAVHLARAFQLDGRRVRLFDTDVQGTLDDWRAASEDAGFNMPEVQTGAAKDLRLRRVTAGADLVVVDAAAKLSGDLGLIVGLSDVVLLPVTPSGIDIWATADVVEIVQARRRATGGKPACALVVSRALPGSTLTGEAVDALSAWNLPVLEGTTQRVAYVRAMSTGRTVLELEPHGKAALEVLKLKDQVTDLIEK